MLRYMHTSYLTQLLLVPPLAFVTLAGVWLRLRLLPTEAVVIRSGQPG